MRIFNHDYAGHPFQCDLSRALAGRGNSVWHAYAASNESPRGILQSLPDDPQGLEFLPVVLPKRIRKESYLQRRRLELMYADILSKRIAADPPDIFLSGNTPTEVQKRLLRVCQNNGVRFISWVQDIYGVAVHRILRKRLPLLGEIIGRWYIHLDKQVLRDSDAVVLISEDFTTFTNACGVDSARVRVIRNWAPVEKIPLLSKNNPWAESQGLQDKMCLVYTGTLGMKHNPGLLLELADHFRSKDSVNIIVVSQGTGPDWLKEKAASEGLTNVRVTGWVPQEVLPEVLATADVLLAILEPDAGIFSVPSKVLTYLCSNRPMVLAVPRENLAARIVLETGAGIVVDPGDTRGFVSAVEKLVNDPAARSEMGNRGRKYAETHFDINHITDAFEEVFKIAMSNR